jgi:hypothetical protein
MLRALFVLPSSHDCDCDYNIIVTVSQAQGRDDLTSKRPMTELFGFPPDSATEEAARTRRSRLCPFEQKEVNREPKH